MKQTHVRERLTAASQQLLRVRPARAALAWSAASPLTPYPEVEWELAQCDRAIALSAAAPPGSLGGAHAAFCAEHRLAPIGIGFEVADTPAHILAARRLQLHDVLHVLLGFGVDWPGEYGVFCFVAAQDYCPQFERAARRLGQVCRTAAPWLRDALGAAECRARQLALGAPRLLSMPIEQEWNTPMLALQMRLKLKQERRLRAIDWQTPASAPEQHVRTAAELKVNEAVL